MGKKPTKTQLNVLRALAGREVHLRRGESVGPWSVYDFSKARATTLIKTVPARTVVAMEINGWIKTTWDYFAGDGTITRAGRALLKDHSHD